MFKKYSLLLGLGLFSISTGLFAALPERLSGTIKIDGSSTVYPITEAVAEEFGKEQSQVKVTVGISGTGGGFKKFCSGETDISNASRPIKSTEEETCSNNKVSFIEVPVAYDALTVVVNPKNTWANSITVAELKTLWAPEAQAKITTWKQVRADWPDKPIKLFGPGVDSGTYDYFTDAIVGKEHSSRGDFTSSEDDNVLVQGVANDMYALGFFGLAYYEENTDKLKALPIDDAKDNNASGPQVPSAANVISGVYQPLSRPLFVYIRQSAIERPEVKAFIAYYLKNAQKLSEEVGYVPLKDSVAKLAQQRFENRVLGSILGKNSQVGANLETLMAKSTNS